MTPIYTKWNEHPITGELFYKGSCDPRRVKKLAKKMLKEYESKNK